MAQRNETPIQESDFRQILLVQMAEFIAASRELGEPLITMANLVNEAFNRQLEFITCAIASHPPNSPADMMQLLTPLSNAINEIQVFRDRNRSVEEIYNHLATVAESIGALSWVSLPQAPAIYIREMKDAGDYFGNRVLSSHRGDAKHVTWINKWHAVLNALEQYVRNHFLTGFRFGVAIESIGRAADGDTQPPPPPPPPSFDLRMSAGDASRAALFNEINQGGLAITQRLRPVQGSGDATDRNVSQVPAVPVDKVHTGAARQTRPFRAPDPTPRLYLDGKKWNVEYYKNDHDLEIPINDKTESVCIYKCLECRVRAGSKIKGMMIDHCKKCSITVYNVISSVELVHCERVDLKCLGEVKTITLDSCDSVQIHLSPASQGVNITHSKCSAMNICILDENAIEKAELPIPEQIQTIIQDEKLLNSVVEKL